MRRRLPRLVAVLGLVALAVACGDGVAGTGERRADQARDVAEAAGLPDDVEQLLALAAAVIDETYRVVYETPSANDGRPVRVVVTQRPPDRRIDVTTETGDVDSTILLDGTTYQCREGPGVATCTALLDAPAAGGLFDPTVVAQVTEALTAAADSYEFRVEDRELLGLPARCLVTELRDDVPPDAALGASAVLCLSNEGVILLAETPTDTLTALEYSVDVNEDTFVLPAAPSPNVPGGRPETRPTVPPD